jgi:hypothetical protein
LTAAARFVKLGVQHALAIAQCLLLKRFKILVSVKYFKIDLHQPDLIG